MKDNVENACKSFELARPYLAQRLQKLKCSFYKKLTKNAIPLFLKGGDIISISPLANGIYELEITALINYLSSQNYSDFFIDIGANIGLSSCQSGINFDEIHMFEPNPDCVSILKVNAKIALKKRIYSINEFGLGVKKELLKLYVPYDNWGGAFIKSKDNSYNQALLSEKDGYGEFSEDNYQAFDVRVESAVEVLSQLFSELKGRGKSNGVVKIDVEGYEDIVLHAIANTIPEDFALFVVFENWADNKSIPDFSSRAGVKARFFKLAETKNKISWAPRWLNSLFDFIQGGTKVKLEPAFNKINAGSYLLALSSF